MHCIAIIRAERGRSNHAICFWNDHLSPCAELSHCSPGPFSSLFAAICRWHAVRWALIRTHCLVISCRACLPRRGGHGTSQRVTGSRLGKIPRFFIYLLLYIYLFIFLVNAAFYFFYHLPFICRFIDSYEIIMIIVTDFDNFFRVCFSHLLQVPPLSLPPPLFCKRMETWDWKRSWRYWNPLQHPSPSPSHLKHPSFDSS